MKIRIEVSSLASTSLSGVAYYTKQLTESLSSNPNAYTSASYFNFRNRQPTPSLPDQILDSNTKIPLRIYAKLQSFNFAPAFDLFKPMVDLTIFPNFATWPTSRSRLRATVIHDLTYIRFPEAVEEKNLAHLRRVVPRSINEADFIITVSEAVKSELVREFSLNPESCIVTPIPPDSIFYAPNNNEIHKKYKIPTKKYIYFIGNLEPRKDLPTLISAYRLLPDDIKAEYSLVLAGGKGWKTEKSVRALNEARDAGENVVHVGYVDQADSPAFFQKASLFVMPSIYEGFGMPILESMASRTPVIASDIPVLRETGGDAVLYAKPGNPQDFTAKILHLLKSPTAIRDLNEKAAIQLRSISWDENCSRIINHARVLLSH